MIETSELGTTNEFWAAEIGSPSGPGSLGAVGQNGAKTTIANAQHFSFCREARRRGFDAALQQDKVRAALVC
jgi:hypothetical protein